jgi:hypothetical protein
MVCEHSRNRMHLQSVMNVVEVEACWVVDMPPRRVLDMPARRGCGKLSWLCVRRQEVWVRHGVTRSTSRLACGRATTKRLDHRHGRSAFTACVQPFDPGTGDARLIAVYGKTLPPARGEKRSGTHAGCRPNVPQPRNCFTRARRGPAPRRRVMALSGDVRAHLNEALHGFCVRLCVSVRACLRPAPSVGRGVSRMRWRWRRHRRSCASRAEPVADEASMRRCNIRIRRVSSRK